jgi:hypothetical protein
MLVLWLLQSGTMIVLAMRKLGGLAMLARIFSIVAGLGWSLLTLGYVVACCAPDPGQMHVETVNGETTGARLEVYHTDQHDHVGVELFWGADAFPIASGHYFQDHFDVDSVVVGTDGQVILRSYFAHDTIVLQLTTGDIQSSTADGSPE